jgi:hypothetical protein
MRTLCSIRRQWRIIAMRTAFKPPRQPMRLFLAIVLFLFLYQMVGEIFFGLPGLVHTQ